MARCGGETPALPEWHSRGYLPHWEAGERAQSITFRLADSLPRALLDRWDEELAHLGDDERRRERSRRAGQALDQGYGACSLRDPAVASLVQEALSKFDGTRYKLHAWAVMPNHVHVLVTPLADSLSAMLHTWKSFTAKAANKLLGAKGAFWQPEYFDRAIRNEAHFAAAVTYIEGNPVAAGLCAAPEDWPFSSANARARASLEMRAGRPRSEDNRGSSGAAKPITKDAIFHYVYGVLHDPVYREKYALNLKREFPRIPFYPDFWRWAEWGETLMALHIGYETVEPWPLRRVETPDEKARTAGLKPKALLKADPDAGAIHLDSETQLTGVPVEAWTYRLGNRSALGWILDQYKEKTPKDPTIAKKFNTYRFADHKEKVIDLLTRVARVSVETMAIVEAMRGARR